MLSSSRKTTVLIVGAGPTGLMMACQLAIQDVPFIIVEEESGPTKQTRAIGIQARSLEIFDQMGIVDHFIKEGEPTTGLDFLANGKLMQHVPLSGLGTGLTKFPFLLILEQSRTETFLLDFLSKHNHTVHWNTKVTSFTQDNSKVLTQLKNAKGEEEQIESDWIAGADGAHSIVRHILDIPLAGKTYQQSLFVLDCKIDSTLSRDNLTVSTSDTTFAAFFPMTKDRWRIIGEAPLSTRGKDTITFEEVETVFAKNLRMGFTLKDPAWIALYHAHHRCVDHFRENRAFLLGDAANIHSPIGAQGMNTGLQDAYNLAWKIGFVHHKKIRPEILDTYNAERLPVAKKLVETTDRLFNFFVSQKRPAIVLRERILPRIVHSLVTHKKTGAFVFRTVSQIGISYHDSFLSEHNQEAKMQKNAPKAGDRLPYLLYSEKGEEKDIQDLITPEKFHLLLFSDDSSFSTEVKNLLEPYKGCVEITHFSLTKETERLASGLGIQQSGYILVRPDLYIACRGNKDSIPSLKQYLKQVFTQH